MQLRPHGLCQFITSDDRPFVWCDEPAVEGASWCQEHYARRVVRVRDIFIRRLEREEAVRASLAEAA